MVIGIAKSNVYAAVGIPKKNSTNYKEEKYSN